ncbi:uncharacterized protein FSUBG_4164 [Fusarium subglutinans]|uniref:Uncharacterized protein n=1 Tax=Gibberella subglutinans TaxID=42677 RepID=A0A8H5V5M3_GIBSU|nr:uncharacterized protein FSUBG_4164 [Fusarium subglutinans]KAF5609154.1 hypothetical protein FSUBG_4164 [Fusarium subglutinans]
MFADEEFSTSDMDEALEEEDEGEEPYKKLKHIYLKSDCGLCNQPMNPDQWTLALIGNPTGTKPVLQMIKSFVPYHPLWKFSSIQNVAESMSSSGTDIESYPLTSIKSWQRGQPVVCDKGELKEFVLKLTVDRDGLSQIEKLERWPEYSPIRSNARAYLFIVPLRAADSHVDFKVWSKAPPPPGNAQISTKLAGDFVLGPDYGPSKKEYLSGKEPTVFVYNVPHKRGHSIYGAVSDKKGDEPSAPFPRILPSGECPPYRGRLHFEASAKDVVHVDVYYEEASGYCRGLLLEYANGAQRALGQCRVGIDPFKSCDKPKWLCYSHSFDDKPFDRIRQCKVECSTGSDSHDHSERDLSKQSEMSDVDGSGDSQPEMKSKIVESDEDTLEWDVVHVAIRSICGLCSQVIAPYEWAIALLNSQGHRHGTRPGYCTKRFRFPKERGITVKGGLFPLCNGEHCRDCKGSPERITTSRPWNAFGLLQPGESRGFSSTAEALGMPQLATLPSEVLQLIAAYSRESILWKYLVIRTRAEELSIFDESISKDDDDMQYNLGTVKKWHRGQDAEFDEDSPESFVFRLILDSHGLLGIERLPDWPEYRSCRYQTSYKYLFIDSKEAERTWVYFRFGKARMKLSPSLSRPVQLWDIPSPPDATCIRTLDLRNITGITFFYYRGTLMGLHAHTLEDPTALTTVKDILPDYEPNLVWIYMPIAHGDRIMRFGLRSWRNDREEPAAHHMALLMTTKLAGDFSLGPNFNDEDRNFFFKGTPTVLFHNTPAKGGITLLGLAGDETQETLRAPRFPIISLSIDQLINGGAAITVDIPLKDAVRIDIFNERSTGYMRGFLLEYKNGAQRSAGQCRVGVDEVTVYHRPVSFCYRTVYGDALDENKHYTVVCGSDTGIEHYGHGFGNGPWKCSDLGLYAKVWCDDVTSDLYTYTPRSREFIAVE